MNNKLSSEDIKLFGKLIEDIKCKHPHITSPSEVMLMDRIFCELLACREVESKPVAFTDADELAFRHDGNGDLWKKPFNFGRDIPLYASPVLSQTPNQFNLSDFIYRQREFSRETFGPHSRYKGIIQHIKKELKEIANEPTDLFEWIDVVILALDGAWRAGHEPEQICSALENKLSKNKARNWPNWRELLEDSAIEHDRTEEAK